MNRVVYICFVLIAIVAVTPLLGQDVHSTQFYNTPYLVNSGLTGQFDGQQRYALYQRSQWRSISVPYRSFALSADWRNLSIAQWVPKIPKVHSGVTFINDRAGDSRFRTTGIMGSLSVPFQLGAWNMTPAMTLGLLNMSIDHSDLYFDQNWTGQIFDPNANNGESNMDDGYTRLQWNTGVAFSRTAGTTSYLFGLGLFNLQQPRQNFLSGDDIRLQRRWVMHGQVKLEIAPQWYAEPMLLWMIQGPYQSINPGARVHYDLQTPGIPSVAYAGFTGRAKDAGNIIIGMRYDTWDVGLSYDINTSDLVPASNRRGGLELTLIYIIPPPIQIPAYRSCKKWM
jgi:type IX secretion system PorP/SprF family membrane protein